MCPTVPFEIPHFTNLGETVRRGMLVAKLLARRHEMKKVIATFVTLIVLAWRLCPLPRKHEPDLESIDLQRPHIQHYLQSRYEVSKRINRDSVYQNDGYYADDYYG